MMADGVETIASAFNRRWETAWNEDGARDVAGLYAEDAILAGYKVAVGRPAIADLLGAIFAQGWTRIAIRLVHAHRRGNVVFVVNDYTASGTGAKSGETLDAKSSHVLIEVDGAWLSAMHTAT
jgi:uncharacterized protein (TIGR02246 family)